MEYNREQLVKELYKFDEDCTTISNTYLECLFDFYTNLSSSWKSPNAKKFGERLEHGGLTSDALELFESKRCVVMAKVQKAFNYLTATEGIEPIPVTETHDPSRASYWTDSIKFEETTGTHQVGYNPSMINIFKEIFVRNVRKVEVMVRALPSKFTITVNDSFYNETAALDVESIKNLFLAEVQDVLHQIDSLLSTEEQNYLMAQRQATETINS